MQTLSIQLTISLPVDLFISLSLSIALPHLYPLLARYIIQFRYFPGRCCLCCLNCSTYIHTYTYIHKYINTYIYVISLLWVDIVAGAGGRKSVVVPPSTAAQAVTAAEAKRVANAVSDPKSTLSAPRLPPRRGPFEDLDFDFLASTRGQTRPHTAPQTPSLPAAGKAPARLADATLRGLKAGTATASLDATPPRRCMHCSAPSAPKTCGGCERAFYCGAACQRAHWHAHKSKCKAEQAIFEAEYKMESRSEWNSMKCTFQNSEARKQCYVCGTNTPSKPAGSHAWSCPACTFENTAGRLHAHNTSPDVSLTYSLLFRIQELRYVWERGSAFATSCITEGKFMFHSMCYHFLCSHVPHRLHPRARHQNISLLRMTIYNRTNLP